MTQTRLGGRLSNVTIFDQSSDADGVHRRKTEHRLFLFRQDEDLGAVPSAGLYAE